MMSLVSCASRCHALIKSKDLLFGNSATVLSRSLLLKMKKIHDSINITDETISGPKFQS